MLIDYTVLLIDLNILTFICIFLTSEYAAVLVEMARNDHFHLSELFHLSCMGKNLFGQRCLDNRSSTVIQYEPRTNPLLS